MTEPRDGSIEPYTSIVIGDNPTEVVTMPFWAQEDLKTLKPTGYIGSFRNKDGLKVIFSKNWDTGETYSRVLSKEEEEEADRAFFSDRVDDD